MELLLDGRQIFVDVGVIELEIVQDQRARTVVDELRALVEERGVVFIGFDDEELSPAEARTDRKISGHAADEEAGIEAGVLQYPGQHARGGGLAVRSGDAEHVNVAQHFARQPFGPRGVRNAAFEQRLDDRHAARHDIAHHHDVRLRRELAGFESRDELDAERLELRAHGWIDVLVRTGDTMARGLGDGGDAAHERAADAENVNVHDGTLASKPVSGGAPNNITSTKMAAKSCPKMKMMHRNIRPFERGAHDAHPHDQQPRLRPRRRAGSAQPAEAGSDPASACRAAGWRSGVQPSAGTAMFTPKNAIMVCTNRSGFLASENANRDHSSGTRTSHDELASRHIPDAHGNEREDESRATATFTTTRPASRPADAGKLSGPPRNSTMSMRRTSNARRFTSIMAGRLYTSPGERRP